MVTPSNTTDVYHARIPIYVVALHALAREGKITRLVSKSAAGRGACGVNLIENEIGAGVAREFKPLLDGVEKVTIIYARKEK